MALYKIMTEEALEKLICSKCNNYLSYGNPKIGSDKVICARCNQDEGILPVFNKNIKNYLFPCINRFDNCRDLLHYSQVQEHEKLCKKNVEHKCPECEYKGNGCQLYHHFIKQHPHNVLKDSSFNIYLLKAERSNYFYRINNNLFVVSYHIEKPKCILQISAESLGHTSKINTCQVTLTSPTSNEEYKITEYKTKVSVEVDIFKYIEMHKENKIKCHLNVNVGADLFVFKNQNTKEKTTTPPNEHDSNQKTKLQSDNNELNEITNALVKNLLPKLTCSNCGCYVIPPIYKCSSDHVKCENCKGSFCNSCDDVVNWYRTRDLEVFHQFIPFPCRWNCEITLPAAKLRDHESNCSKRRYKCIEEWCSWNGSLTKLVDHWHSSIKVHGNDHHVYSFQRNLVEFYQVYNCELFYCRMDPSKENGRIVHIRKVYNASSDVYQARISLSHHCNGVQVTKERDIKIGGLTLMEKTSCDYCEEWRNFKITFIISNK